MKDVVLKDTPNVLLVYSKRWKSIRIIPIESNSITKLTITLHDHMPDTFMRKYGDICIANAIKSLHSLCRCKGKVMYQLESYFQENDLNKTKLEKVVKSLKVLEEVIDVNVEILIP